MNYVDQNKFYSFLNMKNAQLAPKQLKKEAINVKYNF